MVLKHSAWTLLIIRILPPNYGKTLHRSEWMFPSHKKTTSLQTDISCLTAHQQTYRSFSLSVVVSVPVSAADSWETRQQPFQKVTSQHSTSSLSFTPLTAAVPPPSTSLRPPRSASLYVDNGIFCGQVTKTERMWVCVRLCACVCVPLRTVTGCQGRRETERIWQSDSRTVFQPPIVIESGSQNLVWLLRRKEGERKKNYCCFCCCY